MIFMACFFQNFMDTDDFIQRAFKETYYEISCVILYNAQIE